MLSRPRVLLSALLAVTATACFATRSDAGLFSFADNPAPARIVSTGDPGCCDAAPKCCAAAPTCCPKPCIEYRCLFPCREVCCGCECKPPQKLKLSVKDPCCCKCLAEVPVCIPACCHGEPCITDRCGLFGRGVVTYKWCCGYKLNVAFLPCGNVLVTYFGS